MKQATASDFKFGALLQAKSSGQHIRVLNSPRAYEFDAIYDGVEAEMTVDSREAKHYLLVDDGNDFKPSKEYMELVRTYAA